MMAVKGYTKDYYRNEAAAPVVLEFPTIEAAAEYISEKHGNTVDYCIDCIMNDTNGDAFYFEDGSVILYEFN